MKTTAAAIIILLSSLVMAINIDLPDNLAVSTQGLRFIDAHGRQIILRGANAGSISKLPPFLPFDLDPDFDTALVRYVDGFDRLGLNVVRLLVIWEAVEPTRGLYDPAYLDRYDRMVEEFTSRGIRVIVDSHQDVISRRFCGDGFPDWALEEKYRDNRRRADCSLWEAQNFKPGVYGTWDRFWTNDDGIQDRYVEMFRMLAARYRDNPGVIGFEPINEPMPGVRGLARYSEWHEQGLFLMYERVAKAVRSADPGYLIFADICPLENLGTWANDRPRPDIEGLVLAAHYYDVGYVKFQMSTGDDISIMRNGLAKHLALAKTWDVPLFIGEYGIEMKRNDAPKYVQDLYTVFDELLISGTIWEATASKKLWNLRDKNIFTDEARPREAATFLDRPYPMAVDGTIERFDFEETTGKAELVFDNNGTGQHPTLLRLPQRVYPDHKPTIDAPGCEYNIDPVSQILYIRNCPPGQITVLVTQ